MSFSHLTADKASAETANGQIKLAGHQCGAIEAETINGLIDLRGSSESIDVQSFNGNIMQRRLSFSPRILLHVNVPL